MHWCFGLHIVKGDAVLVFVRDLGRDLAIDNFLKDSFWHEVFRILNVESWKKDRNGKCRISGILKTEKFERKSGTKNTLIWNS